MISYQCPYCGLNRPARVNGVGRCADSPAMPCGPEQRQPSDGRPMQTLDRVMNWVVGTLLVTAVAVLSVLQSQ